MGLRADKQQNQRRLIIENAIALSRERGNEVVRVRDIAARCGISDATFFNYFTTKDAVLQEWLDDLVEGALARASARHAEEGIGLRRVIRGLADELALLAGREGPLLGRALRTARVVGVAEASGPARGRAERGLPARRLIETGIARDEIRRDVAPAQLAQMLRSVVVGALAHGVADGAPGERELAERIRGSADVLLDGLRRRNERVRAPSASAGRSAAGPSAIARPGS